MLPESLAPSLREQLSRARAWWLKDGPRAAAALRFPTPLSGSIRAPGIRRGSGFCAAHAFDRSTERCRASPSHVTRPDLSARLQTCRRTSRHHEARHTAHPPPLVRDGLAPQRLRHSNRAGSARPFRRLYDDDLHACAESWRCRSALTA